MKALLTSISLLAVISMLVPTAMASTDFKVFAIDDTAIHELDIKATEGANRQIIPVSGFAIQADSGKTERKS